ncbi:DUF4386 domain-containing protein [Fusibacter bizertensis]
MNKDRKSAILIGVFYIVAAVTSIIAVLLYQPILASDWYNVASNGQWNSVLFGVLNDLFLVVSAVGTAVMFFPYLRKVNEHIALFHFSFRFMEAVLIAIGAVGILGLLSTSSSFQMGTITNLENIVATGLALQAFHRWTFMLGPNFMLGLNTTAYSVLLFKSGLVPKKLAIFGIIAAISVFFAGLLDMFGIIDPNSGVKGILALPVGVYEMSLAFYLIFKGFVKKNLVALLTQ